MKTFALLLVAFVLAVSGCAESVPTSGDMSTTPALKRDRPFKGTISGTVSTGSHDCDAGSPIYYSGSGNMTHLGNTSVEMYHCLNTSTFAFTGTGVLTAANGDEVYVEYEGQIFSGGVSETSFEVTGGTGRFDGATGEGTADGLQQGATLALDIDGTINY